MRISAARRKHIERRERKYAIMDTLTFKRPLDDETAAFRIQQLINEGHKVTAFQSMFEKTTLFVAVQKNWPETCRVILNSSDDAHFPYWECPEGFSALHCAIPTHNYPQTAKIPAFAAAKVLIEEYGIDPRVGNKYGLTPASRATNIGHTELAAYFKQQEKRFTQQGIPLPDWYKRT